MLPSFFNRAPSMNDSPLPPNRLKLIPHFGEIDARAVTEFHMPSLQLMETAGLQIAQIFAQNFGQFSPLAIHGQAPVIFLCGKGNNGGDGFVCARYLKQWGYDNLWVLHTHNEKEMKPDASLQFQKLLGLGISTTSLQEASQLEIAQRLKSGGAIIDGLLGTGLTQNLSPELDNFISFINDLRNTQQETAPLFIMGIDVPSGVDSSTGAVLGNGIQCDVTVTLAGGKPGLYLYPGRKLAGRVETVDIGIPESLLSQHPSKWYLVDDLWAKIHLPTRPPQGHKYAFGSVLVIAGSRKMPGAAILSATSALRTGCGTVTLASPDSVFTRGQLPWELMHWPLPEDETGNLCLRSLEALPSLNAYTTLIIGPGLGVTKGTQEFFGALFQRLQDYPGTIVLDADGLNLYAHYQQSSPPKANEGSSNNKLSSDKLSSSWILTPHVGEFMRLFHLNASPEELKRLKQKLLQDSISALTLGQQALGCQMILKNGPPLCANTRDEIWIPPVGNSGMATAGSGDVLSGILGGLLAQGVSPTTAVWLGAYLHGIAGDIAASTQTEYSMIASDIISALPQSFKRLQN
jgi:ADP-dependent NAD(P)H-hydrate dehydratase / NAD(P)H-hydrate epimerase